MTGSLMVRLIDVVLIILFGFLAISDIQIKRQIRLPEPGKTEIEPETSQIGYLFVHINPAGDFVLTIDGRSPQHIGTLMELRPALREAAEELRKTEQNPLVVIDPDPDASMQSTVDVYDLCEIEQLPRSINMELTFTGASEGNQDSHH